MTRRIFLLVGPTATGKSTLAMRIADTLPVTLISADSVQVYRGLDVGSAKPSADDRIRVPHRALDLHDPGTECSVADWMEAADEAIEEAGREGRVPLVVGGTGFYVRTLIRGLPGVPAPPEALREEIRTQWSERPAEDAHAFLGAIDPTLAAQLAPADRMRVWRGIEVWAHTGRPLSAWQAEQRDRPDRYRYAALALGGGRGPLRRRVQMRTEAMLARGWVEEVRGLLDRGVSPRSMALQAIGYRQVVQHLQGDMPQEALRDAIVQVTRDYVRRQLIWFRHQLPEVRWWDWRDAEADPAAFALALADWWKQETPWTFGLPNEPPEAPARGRR
jgi:tRNA dimethylallyltransferase